MITRKKKRADPPDKYTMEEDEDTMDYEKARQHSVWQIERELADEMADQK